MIVALVPVIVVLVAVVLELRPDDAWDDDSRPAAGPAPAQSAAPQGWSVALPSTPLLIDGRLRVTSEGHRVAAQPIASPADADYHWSYTRGGEEAVAMALAARPANGGALVVVLWADGRAVGLDALTGRPVWRVDTRVKDAETPVRDRLGAYGFDPATVTGPQDGEPGLLTVVSAVGGDVVVAQLGDLLVGIDAATGQQLWHRDDAGCQDEITGFSWWALAGSVVVNATCYGEADAVLRVVDPRDGHDTETITSSPGWPSENTQGSASIGATGCVWADGCTMIEHHPTGSTFGLEPVRWTVQAGRLAEVGPEGLEADGIDARLNGSFELFGIDRGTGEIVWKVQGQDFGLPQFSVTDTTADAVWVGSHSWDGGPPALVRFNPSDGSLTGCLPPPTERPITDLRAFADGYVVASDFVDDTGNAVANDTGSVVMLVPEPQPACPQ